MKQTVVAQFDSLLKANEAVRVLLQARFEADRLPRRPGQSEDSATGHSSSLLRLARTAVRKFQDFMDADMYLQPYARALARGCFVVKVYAAHDLEAVAAKKILAMAGGKEIDVLADEWVEG